MEVTTLYNMVTSKSMLKSTKYSINLPLVNDPLKGSPPLLPPLQAEYTVTAPYKAYPNVDISTIGDILIQLVAPA